MFELLLDASERFLNQRDARLPWKELYCRDEISQHNFEVCYYSAITSNRIGVHIATDHTVPYGTALWGGAAPGTSCQATIVLSLRDISQQALSRPEPESPTNLYRSVSDHARVIFSRINASSVATERSLRTWIQSS